MRFFILLFILHVVVFAQSRPKIALVLSGGGARGGAHVGVLKILEKKHIPIDMIVGTSMGSLVGGLYASGKSPQEIEKILITTNWKKVITTDFERKDVPIRKKESEYAYQGRLGVGINHKNETGFQTGLLKRQPYLFKLLKETQNGTIIKDFDKLRIPFRSVATNIKNGEAVVIKSGSLARAIYASSSIPGGFQPININGIDLVDGGVSDNMPIDVAKKMGADIIIAVDVSEDFDKNINVDSYFVIMSQLVNILTRKNVNESLKLLNKKDVLITPNLKEFSSLDADKYPQIIKRGEEAALKIYATKLKNLSLTPEQYALYQQKHSLKNICKSRTIDEIKLHNTTKLSNKIILTKLGIKVGDKLDEEKLRNKLMHLYNTMEFDRIDYDVEKKDNRNILHINATPSWNSNGEIRLAFGLEDDFEGHSAYSIKFGYTMFGVNSYGAEWKSDFEIGKNKLAKTEFFQPLDAMQKYYIKPHVKYFEKLYNIPLYRYMPSLHGNREMKIKRYGGGIALGLHVGRGYEFEIGANAYNDENIIDSIEFNKHYSARPLHVALNADTLDNLNFPNTGYKLNIKYTKEMAIWGGDYDFEQFYANFEKPLSFSNNIFDLRIKYGQTYNIIDNKTALAGSYTLGGLFNLSGYELYSFNNDNMILGVLKYRYRLKDGGFFSTFNAPLYVGFSLEIGDTWNHNQSLKLNDTKQSATIYFAADTLFGPFYIAHGFSADGENATYLYLGEKF